MQTVEFKVYLQNSDSTVKEIRRFKLDTKATQDFAYLCKTLMYYFPEIRGQNFNVSWIDTDNDVIVITSNEELEIATKYLGFTLKLYVKLGPHKQEMRTFKKEDVVHFNVYCDHCDRGISGIRYKCIQCEDYDLCSECETLGAHPKHYMIRMPRPLEWSSYHGRRLLHYMKKFFKRDDAQPSKDAGPPKETLKQADKNDSFVDLDINIEIIPETPNAPESNKTEKKEESEGNAKEPTVENPTAKVPEEESKLVTSTEVEASMSNSKSPVVNAEAPAKKVATTEGWTMIDKNEASGITYASSVSSNLSETSEKHDSAPMPSAPREHASCQTMYPHLEKEDEQIYSANPRIRAATEAMVKMGFSNKGGLLTHLLEVEDCNINKVLDLLQSNSHKSGV